MTDTQDVVGTRVTSAASSKTIRVARITEGLHDDPGADRRVAVTMIKSFPGDVPLPPSLSMDAYADFVSENLRTSSRDSIDRQKAIEERITARFTLLPSSPCPVRPAKQTPAAD